MIWARMTQTYNDTKNCVTMKLSHLFSVALRPTKLAIGLSRNLLLGIALLPACSFESYQAKPIDQQVVRASFKQKSLNDAAFAQFLNKQSSQPLSLPIARWDNATLTHAAHYFHPDLSVARAEWQLAQTQAKNAAYKPLPTVNADIGRSDRANGDINPFSYTFSIDLPIITHDKQAINIAGFEHLSNIAKLKLAETTWKLRQQVAYTFIAIHSNGLQIENIQKDIALKTDIVSILEKRLQYGEASSLAVSRATRDLYASQAQLATLKQQALPLRAQLAKDLGLPARATQDLEFNFDALNAETMPMASAETQEAALLNRLDIRIGLENYAIAENKLKLAVANQYPNLSIRPGIAYEFGDTVWSLGASSLLNLLNNGLDKNKAAIKAAEKARALAAAKFEQSQIQVIANTAIANATYQAAIENVQTQQTLVSTSKASLKRINSQFEAGMIDRLALTLAKLDAVQAEKQLNKALTQRNTARLAVENTLQKPLTAITGN